MLSISLAAVMGYQRPNLTFKSNFESIGKVIERLSAETGSPMAAFGDIKAYPIYINVKDVSEKDLLDRIAAVAGAEWEKKGDSYYLSASAALRQKQERAGDPELIAAIEATINKPLAKKKSPQEIEAEMKGMEKNPAAASKMMTEIFSQMFQADEGTLEMLKLIGSKDLSSIVEGRRVVLSSTPTSMQIAMSGKAINATLTYLKKLASNAKKADPKKPGDAEGQFDLGAMFGGGQGLRKPELVSQINTIQTVFQINSRSMLNIDVSAFTRDGVGVYKRTVQLPIVNPESAMPAIKGQTLIETSGVAHEYAQALEDGKKIDPFMGLITSIQSGGLSAMSIFMSPDGPTGNAEGPGHAISPKMRELMGDPGKNEPLAYLLGPLLDQQASTGKNIVALPSDDVITTLCSQLTKEGATIEGVLDAVDRSMTEKITQDGTWTIIQASSPLELRSAFCKRDALTALIKSGSTKGYVNLDDCSQFATAQDTARGSEILGLPIVTAVFRTSDLGSASALTSIGFDSLKLYATLSDFQKQALASKRPVPLASLNPAQTGILSRMVYNNAMPPFKNGDNAFEGIFGSDVNGDNGDMMGGMASLGMAMAGPMMSAFGMGDITMDSERTVLLPEGIPVVGQIQLKSMPADGVMAIDTATGNKMITMPEMVGMMDSDTFSQLPGMKNMRRKFDQYKLAKHTSYLLLFKLGKNASYFTSLYDVWVDDSKTYTRDQLPDKIKERMDSAAKMSVPAETKPPVIPPLR
jgi:hypothetical protein